MLFIFSKIPPFYLYVTMVSPYHPQSRSQSFVPLDQRSENESSGSNHYERTKEITEFWLSGSLRICIYGACLKWLLPELSFFDRWSRGTKLWERDCIIPSFPAQIDDMRSRFSALSIHPSKMSARRERCLFCHKMGQNWDKISLK